MDHQQQQQLLLQQQHQQQAQHQHQQQFTLLQQLQKQAQHQQQQQQASAIARFPSNIDAHLRPPGFARPLNIHPQNPNPNTSPIPNLQQQQQQSPASAQNAQQQLLLQQQQKGIRPPVNQIELQMAYQDAWRVCHPDVKRPFSSLEDACESSHEVFFYEHYAFRIMGKELVSISVSRLLPYHVVADYEAEEDDRILDSDTTGQMPSRCQQWDHNIAAKVAEFTGTFEKQALAFNIITRKRALGEFRSEERLMAEQILLQEEKRLLLEAKAEMDAREKAAQYRMAAMAQAEQARAESQAHAEMMARAPIRGSALGMQGNNMLDMGEQDQSVNPDPMVNWGNNGQREEKEPSEDFLNDEEGENGESGSQGEWREVGEFDLNTR